jgi:hypothetical protein
LAENKRKLLLDHIEGNYLYDKTPLMLMLDEQIAWCVSDYDSFKNLILQKAKTMMRYFHQNFDIYAKDFSIYVDNVNLIFDHATIRISRDKCMLATTGKYEEYNEEQFLSVVFGRK